LVSEIFDKLVVNVGDPRFQSDGHVLKQKVDRFLFFEHRLKLDQLIRLELFEHIRLLHQLVSLLQTHFINLPHQYPGQFTCALLALSERVVVVHDYDYLAGH
jgi:hypothetical protein